MPHPASTEEHEYRPVIICVDNPCTYCRAPGDVPDEEYPTEHVVDVTYTSADAAREHGRELTRLVYGSSVHRVALDSRPVGGWTRMPDPQ